MPWSNQGGGGGNRGPWGRGPGGGAQPPNFDDILKRGQDRFRGLIPGGAGGARGLILILIVAVVIWLGTGFYRVQPDEQGVELIFGKWVDTTVPGLNFNMPAPIGLVYRPKVTRLNRVEVGFRALGDGRRSAGRDVTQESLMLTGDENIIDVHFVVFWKVDTRLRKVTVNGVETEVQDGVQKFLFNIRNPEQTVKDAAESAMREIVGKSEFESTRTERRAQVATETMLLIQTILDDYGAGIEITNLEIQDVNPPATVMDAFRDVQAARADKERMVNEAQAYSNEVEQKAEGEFQRIVRASEAYRAEKIARAEGEASRFLAVYSEYQKEKDITTQRIYLETMREILSGMDKILIDNSKGGSGVVPYLPLDQLNRGAAASGATSKTGGQQ